MIGNPQAIIRQKISSGMAPQQIVQQMIQIDPSLTQTLVQIRNMSNGQNMRDFTMQYLKQTGTDMQQVEQMANLIGAK